MTTVDLHLDAEQQDLVNLIDRFASDHQLALKDDVEQVDSLRAGLAAVGVWTIGAQGGGGADHHTTMVALARLGRYWPALAWASAQSQVAADLLAGQTRYAALVDQWHRGTATIAIVDGGAAHVHVEGTGQILRGRIDRVDPGGPTPSMLILREPTDVLVVDAAAMTSTALERTGLAGAFTQHVQIDASGASCTEVSGVDVDGTLSQLLLYGAAIATGIARAAADLSAEYTTTRHQFGASLSALSPVQDGLIRQASSVTVTTAAARANVGDLVTSFATAEAACEAAIDTAATALQSLGGYGYLTEYPAERYLRDAISLRAAIGLESAKPKVRSRLIDTLTSRRTVEAR